MFRREYKKGDLPTRGTLEGLRSTWRKKEKIGGTRSTDPGQTTEGRSSRGDGHGPALGGIRLGFLRDPATAPGGVRVIICGASKRKPGISNEEQPAKKPRNTRPIIDMLLHDGTQRKPIKVLLDTGCSVALINQQTVSKWGIQKREHKEARTIESFTGATVEGAGQYYTRPLRLQHRNHFSREVFEISPMEEGIDVFLPFKWIEQHPPQGAWETKEIRFNSAGCLNNCGKFATNDFSLTWDDTVATNPEASLIGYVSAASDQPLEDVPMEFRQYLGIMSQEAADALPEHRPYDCKIDHKEGATAPW